MSRWIKAVLLLGSAIIFLLYIAWGQPRPPAAGQNLLDLTYPFGHDSIYWPTGTPFTTTRVFRGLNEQGWWYATNDYRANEHGGTHVDAPIHFAEGGRAIHQIPLAEWIGPACVVDVTAACAKDRNYLLRSADLQEHEKMHGTIGEGSWVIMYTGIGTRYYPDREKVLGTAATGPDAVKQLSFPGFSAEAVQFLIGQRRIKGIGIDTPSIDYGKSTDFPVHRLLCGADKLAIENLARLDQLPATGAILYAIPVLIQDGTGAPARVFAQLPAKY